MNSSNRKKRNRKERAVETQKPIKQHKASSKTSWIFYPVLVLLAAVFFARFHIWSSKPPTLRPFEAPLVKNCEIFDVQYRNEKLWGTYRPGLYFGLRMKRPSSLLAGLMWFDPSWYENINEIRHLAKQEDGIRYGWTRHNAKDLAIQQLEDANYFIETSWVKRLDDDSGVGGDWSLRISARNKVEQTRSKEISFLFYIVDEATPGYSPKDSLGWELLNEDIEPNSKRVLTGNHSYIGQWQLGLHSKQMKNLDVRKFGSPLTSYHNITDEVKSLIYENLSEQYHSQGVRNLSELVVALPDPPMWLESSMEHPNFAVIQITGTLPFEVEFVFLTGAAQTNSGRFSSLMGESLTRELQSKTRKFDTEFDRKFGDLETTEEIKEAKKKILSSVLGGIGYFYGSSKVRLPVEGQNGEVHFKTEDYFETPLLTATPSRSFFPRGFLWDEGFHQLVVQKWDPLLSIDVLAHWMDLTNEEGWIPREQILGEEARSRVPSEFVVQDPSVGNPPTLFLPLMELISTSNSTPFFRLAWPRLTHWFAWMVKNHLNSDGTGMNFRWSSREKNVKDKLNPLTLDSGLDDYPRASHPTLYERHLDLRCWILFAAEAMLKIGETIEIPAAELEQYSSLGTKLRNFENLKKLHLETKKKWFLDFGFHSEEIRLQRVLDEDNGQEKLVRQVEVDPRFQLVEHFGYVSLFPLFLHLIPTTDPLLKEQLELLKDPELLWTDYGLRSLSKISTFYQKHNTEHDPPYWRGAIWVNINYLAIKSLKHYHIESGPYAEDAGRLFKKLKSNLINNILQEFTRTGFLWEQYDDVTGTGKGCRPFTGWTSLILLM